MHDGFYIIFIHQYEKLHLHQILIGSLDSNHISPCLLPALVTNCALLFDLILVVKSQVLNFKQMNSFYKSRATPLRIWMSLSYLKPAENVLQWLRLSIGYTLLQPLTVYKESLQCICMTISVLEYDYFAYRSYASTTEFLHYFTICVALLS